MNDDTVKIIGKKACSNNYIVMTCQSSKQKKTKKKT